MTTEGGAVFGADASQWPLAAQQIVTSSAEIESAFRRLNSSGSKLSQPKLTIGREFDDLTRNLNGLLGNVTSYSTRIKERLSSIGRGGTISGHGFDSIPKEVEKQLQAADRLFGDFATKLTRLGLSPDAFKGVLSGATKDFAAQLRAEQQAVTRELETAFRGAGVKSPGIFTGRTQADKPRPITTNSIDADALRLETQALRGLNALNVPINDGTRQFRNFRQEVQQGAPGVASAVAGIRRQFEDLGRIPLNRIFTGGFSATTQEIATAKRAIKDVLFPTATGALGGLPKSVPEFVRRTIDRPPFPFKPFRFDTPEPLAVPPVPPRSGFFGENLERDAARQAQAVASVRAEIDKIHHASEVFTRSDVANTEAMRAALERVGRVTARDRTTTANERDRITDESQLAIAEKREIEERTNDARSLQAARVKAAAENRRIDQENAAQAKAALTAKSRIDRANGVVPSDLQSSTERNRQYQEFLAKSRAALELDRAKGVVPEHLQPTVENNRQLQERIAEEKAAAAQRLRAEKQQLDLAAINERRRQQVEADRQRQEERRAAVAGPGLGPITSAQAQKDAAAQARLDERNRIAQEERRAAVAGPGLGPITSAQADIQAAREAREAERARQAAAIKAAKAAGEALGPITKAEHDIAVAKAETAAAATRQATSTKAAAAATGPVLGPITGAQATKDAAKEAEALLREEKRQLDRLAATSGVQFGPQTRSQYESLSISARQKEEAAKLANFEDARRREALNPQSAPVRSTAIPTLPDSYSDVFSRARVSNVLRALDSLADTGPASQQLSSVLRRRAGELQAQGAIAPDRVDKLREDKLRQFYDSGNFGGGGSGGRGGGGTPGGGGAFESFLGGLTSKGFNSKGGFKPDLEGIAGTAGTLVKYGVLSAALYGVAGGAATAKKEIVDYIDSLTDASTAMDGGVQHFDALRNKIDHDVVPSLEKVSRLAGANVGESLDAFTRGVRAFTEPQDNFQQQARVGTKAAQVAGQLALITGGDLKDRTGDLVAIGTAFNYTGEQLDQVTDAIANARNLGGDLNQISQGLANFAQVAGTAGLNAQEAANLISVVQAKTDQSGQTVATRLGRITQIIGSASNQQILKRYGVDTSQNFLEQLAELNKGLDRAPANEQKSVISRLAGTANVREFTVALQNADKIIRQSDEDLSKAGAGADLFNRKSADLAGLFRKIGGDVKNIYVNLQRADVGRGIGVFLVILEKVLDAANKVLSAFAQLPGILTTSTFAFLQIFGIVKAIQAIQGRRALANLAPSGPISPLAGGETFLVGGAGATTRATTRAVTRGKTLVDVGLAAEAAAVTEVAAAELKRAQVDALSAKVKADLIRVTIEQTKADITQAETNLAGATSTEERNAADATRAAQTERLAVLEANLAEATKAESAAQVTATETARAHVTVMEQLVAANTAATASTRAAALAAGPAGLVGASTVVGAGNVGALTAANAEVATSTQAVTAAKAQLAGVTAVLTAATGEAAAASTLAGQAAAREAAASAGLAAVRSQIVAASLNANVTQGELVVLLHREVAAELELVAAITARQDAEILATDASVAAGAAADAQVAALTAVAAANLKVAESAEIAALAERNLAKASAAPLAGRAASAGAGLLSSTGGKIFAGVAAAYIAVTAVSGLSDAQKKVTSSNRDAAGAYSALNTAKDDAERQRAIQGLREAGEEYRKSAGGFFGSIRDDLGKAGGQKGLGQQGRDIIVDSEEAQRKLDASRRQQQQDAAAGNSKVFKDFTLEGVTQSFDDLSKAGTSAQETLRLVAEAFGDLNKEVPQGTILPKKLPDIKAQLQAALGDLTGQDAAQIVGQAYVNQGVTQKSALVDRLSKTQNFSPFLGDSLGAPTGGRQQSRLDDLIAKRYSGTPEQQDQTSKEITDVARADLARRFSDKDKRRQAGIDKEKLVSDYFAQNNVTEATGGFLTDAQQRELAEKLANNDLDSLGYDTKTRAAAFDGFKQFYLDKVTSSLSQTKLLADPTTSAYVIQQVVAQANTLPNNLQFGDSAKVAGAFAEQDRIKKLGASALVNSGGDERAVERDNVANLNAQLQQATKDEADARLTIGPVEAARQRLTAITNAINVQRASQIPVTQAAIQAQLEAERSLADTILEQAQLEAQVKDFSNDPITQAHQKAAQLLEQKQLFLSRGDTAGADKKQLEINQNDANIRNLDLNLKQTTIDTRVDPLSSVSRAQGDSDKIFAALQSARNTPKPDLTQITKLQTDYDNSLKTISKAKLDLANSEVTATANPRSADSQTQAALRVAQAQLAALQPGQDGYWDAYGRLQQLELQAAQNAVERSAAARAVARKPGDTVGKAQDAVKNAIDARNLTLPGTPERDRANANIADARYAVAQQEAQRAAALRGSRLFPGSSIQDATNAIRDAKANIELAKQFGDQTGYYTALGQLKQAKVALAQAELENSKTKYLLGHDATNPINQAVAETLAARQKLSNDQGAGAPGDVINKDRLDLKTAQANEESTRFSQRLSAAQTADQLGRISHAQYIKYLDNEHNRLKSIKNRTYQQNQELDQIDLALQSAKQQFAGVFNIGDIKLPTPYEVRRFIGAQTSQLGQYAQGNTTTVNIQVDGADTAKVQQIMSTYLGPLRTQAVSSAPRK